MAGGRFYGRRRSLRLAGLPPAGTLGLVLKIVISGFEASAIISRDAESGYGSYVLLLQLNKEQTIAVGALKEVYFPPGDYAYVGSALGGFKARLNRHRQRGKKPHWHIDYLRREAELNDIIICPGRDRIECALAQALSQHFAAIPGFGCSDCHCPSHLFFAPGGMKPEIMTILKSLGRKPRLVLTPWLKEMRA